MPAGTTSAPASAATTVALTVAIVSGALVALQQRVNGELGLATSFNGKLHSVTTIDTDGKRIYAYYTVANPDKLADFSRAG